MMDRYHRYLIEFASGHTYATACRYTREGIARFVTTPGMSTKTLATAHADPPVAAWALADSDERAGWDT